MIQAVPVLCLAFALGTSGCIHSLGGLPTRPEAPPVAAPARLVAIAQVVPATTARKDRSNHSVGDSELGDLLRERLASRGAREVLDQVDDASTAPLQLSLWSLGSRSTGMTRVLGLPWMLVSIATFGLVPNREAREYVIELRAVDHGAASPGRVRIARRSYVVVSWAWTPFVLFVSPSKSGRGPSRTLHREGLAGAIDEALDEVLPLVPFDHLPDGPEKT